MLNNGAGPPRRRERWAARENEKRGRGYAAALEAWQRDDTAVRQMLAMAKTHRGVRPRHALLELQRDESIMWTAPRAGIVETTYPLVPEPATYQRLLPPGQRPVTVPLQVLPNVGAVTVTNKRVVLHGQPEREWRFAKLTAVAHTTDGHTLVQVANRKKTSGLSLTPQDEQAFRFHLVLALADFANDRAGLVRHLELLLAWHQPLRPAPPIPARPEQAPAAARVGPGALIAGVAALMVLLCVGAGLASTETRDPSRPDTAPTMSDTRNFATSDSPTPAVTSESPTPSPTSATRSKAPPPVPKRTTRKPAPKPVSLCGAPRNPYGYNFCGGDLIYEPKPDTCLYFDCIDNWENGKGHMVQCNDGTYSMSGGRRGSCSWHDGNRRPVYR